MRVTAPDVQGIHTWSRADDVGGVWRVASRYALESDSAGALYGFKPKGKTATVVELWTAQDFALWVDDRLVERKDNPFGFIPFIIFPNLPAPKQAVLKRESTRYHPVAKISPRFLDALPVRIYN